MHITRRPPPRPTRPPSRAGRTRRGASARRRMDRRGEAIERLATGSCRGDADAAGAVGGEERRLDEGGLAAGDPPALESVADLDLDRMGGLRADGRQVDEARSPPALGVKPAVAASPLEHRSLSTPSQPAGSTARRVREAGGGGVVVGGDEADLAARRAGGSEIDARSANCDDDSGVRITSPRRRRRRSVRRAS